ncbi:DDB1- and CUL4-associated factor 5 [Chiloscyllium plagiosum]|uniref:DDB1- and CUL4-associated factor 5 n=1 Tax=Chiloscyllium plagiosum TaxID=36176 RepID=UPI001CB82594|nr:DDB1- and CUL4-associated factor 5 [Chiloscyllium plagiosum]
MLASGSGALSAAGQRPAAASRGGDEGHGRPRLRGAPAGAGGAAITERKKRRRRRRMMMRRMEEPGPGPGPGPGSLLRFLGRRAVTGDRFLREAFQRQRLSACRNLFKKDLLGHFGCVNAIEFSSGAGELLVSGGDDRRVLLWHVDKAIHSKAKPVQLKGEHLSNIFCLAFDSTNTHLFSGGNDEQVIVHDVESTEIVNVFPHDDAVYGLSVSPVNDKVFASSSDDGRVLIWDIRDSHGEPFCLANYPSAFHSVMFNPVEPRLLATANSKEGVGLWDIRKPRSSLLRYGGKLPMQSAMSVRFNSSGTQLLALRRRLPPVLYDIHSPQSVFEFDNQGYFNSCTMKSCCFAGDRDQFVLSGSDDFNLYMWRIPSSLETGGPARIVNGAFMVLKGHRSIVNQVRFNSHSYMICSSGVEKIIKVWSPYLQPDCAGDLEGVVEDDTRNLYTHEEYISLVLNSGSGLSHDYANQSVQEDPRMMAFFDSLVRREIEGWSSDSDSDLNESTILQLRAGTSERSGYSDTESSASLPLSPQQGDDSDEATYTLDRQKLLNTSAVREDLRSRRQRLSALRRYQDERLRTLSNDSDSSENNYQQVNTDSDADPVKRPRSPSPEANDSSSSSSNGRRRASMRQRNAARAKQKLRREKRSTSLLKKLKQCSAETRRNYSQVRDGDNSSASSSPERSSTEFDNRGRVSPYSDSESEVRKVYKAYSKIQNTFKSQLKTKGDTTAFLSLADMPNTSERGSSINTSTQENDSARKGPVVPHRLREESCFDEHNGESTSSAENRKVQAKSKHSLSLGHECSTVTPVKEITPGEQVYVVEDAPSSCAEHCYEAKKVNGKSVCVGSNSNLTNQCQAFGSQAQELCGHAQVLECVNAQTTQQISREESGQEFKSTFSPEIYLVGARSNSDHTDKSKTRTCDVEDRCSETSCNNGLFERQCAGHCEQTCSEQMDSAVASKSEAGGCVQVASLHHKEDCSQSGISEHYECAKKMIALQKIFDCRQGTLSPAEAGQPSGGLKRLRKELDPDYSPAEKKQKT